jgi:hypothetical protein
MSFNDNRRKGFERRFERVRAFLRQPSFQGFTRRELLLPAWHSIAALSNMAEAVTNLYVEGSLDIEETTELLQEIVRRAIHPKVNPYRKNIGDVRNFYKWGYYLEHLNICLGSLARVRADNEYVDLNSRVSEHLRENSLKYPNYHADLHARSRMKWPADQAAILYSLWLYDQNYHVNISREPIEGWFDYMDKHAIHEPTKLYITEVMGVKRFSNLPRGCALSYLSHYVGRFAFYKAQPVWEMYKTHFLRNTILGSGFREYPENIRYRWTPDSGPIIVGLGAAATGIGLNAASTLEDRETYHMLEKILNKVQFCFNGLEKIFGNNIVTRVGTDFLATSIRLNAETKCRWY